jgi:hypothetical protein
MKTPDWRSVLRWTIVVPVFLVSFYAAFILEMIVSWLDWPLTSFFSKIGVPPHIAVEFARLLTLLIAASFCAFSTAFAIGFALRSRVVTRLWWGFTGAILLVTPYVWILNGHTFVLSHVIAVTVAGIALVGAIVATVKHQRRVHLASALAAVILATLPLCVAWATGPKQPPPTRPLWSVVLQKNTWQGMNTGSEYAATRQVVFAGSRVIAVFDSGSAGYENSWPQSDYRILSLDQKTGAIKNELPIKGRWGSMPYIYATADGHVNVQGATPLTLNPDLSTANAVASPPTQEVKLTDNRRWNGSYAEDEGFITKTDATGDHLLYHGTCAHNPQMLSQNAILVFGCGTVTLIDSSGNNIRTQPIPYGYAYFAGAAQNGTRFAVDFSDSEGDPAYPLYERMVIYGSASLKPLARIDIKDLPERESWSAFSPDGHYFAAGNPNLLSLYEIP